MKHFAAGLLPERFVRALGGQVLSHGVPGDPLHVAAVAAEDGHAAGRHVRRYVPDDYGVIHAACGEPAVTRAPRQVQHVAVMLAQGVGTPRTRHTKHQSQQLKST
jgi:hypothetical protein